jgi:hypothetical protein
MEGGGDNKMIVEVLPDGVIRVTSPGQFSAALHADADAFVKWLHEKCAGEVKIKKLDQHGEHHHHHGEHHHHH